MHIYIYSKTHHAGTWLGNGGIAFPLLSDVSNVAPKTLTLRYNLYNPNPIATNFLILPLTGVSIRKNIIRFFNSDLLLPNPNNVNRPQTSAQLHINPTPVPIRVVASNGHSQASGKSGSIRVVASLQESRCSGMAVRSGDSMNDVCVTIYQLWSILKKETHPYQPVRST